ncbi:MAG: amino acid racemase [Fibrobacterota bacterium]
MKKKPLIIGIAGGVGPYAGLDLNRKIFDETRACTDQDHLPVILSSMPGMIGDRTRFLLGKEKVNPAYALASVLHALENAGASVVAIPCNTAHSPRIFSVIQKQLRKHRSQLRLLNMIEETGRFIRKNYPGLDRVGVLATLGTYASRVYLEILEPMGISVIIPDLRTQKRVQAAIYDKTYGIKALANPVTSRARRDLLAAVASLKAQDAEAVILGCTEIPLALTDRSVGSLPLVDPTRVLARALIIAAAGPGRMKKTEDYRHLSSD